MLPLCVLGQGTLSGKNSGSDNILSSEEAKIPVLFLDLTTMTNGPKVKDLLITNMCMVFSFACYFR